MFSTFSTDSIIPRNSLSNKCSFYFCAIHLPPTEEGENLNEKLNSGFGPNARVNSI